jgi:hypothetical protein
MNRNSAQRDEIAKTLRFPSSGGGVDAPSDVRKARPGWSEIFLTTPSAPASERDLFLSCRSHPSSGGGESRRLRSFRLVFVVPWILLAVFALAPTGVLAQQAAQPKTEEPKTEDAQKETEDAQPKTEEDSKLKSVPGGKALGMSILGNQEAPKALVIVPWKTSELGNGPMVSTMLDDSKLPVDKEVFMRMLSYYDIRSEAARPVGAPANANTAAPASTAQRRK